MVSHAGFLRQNWGDDSGDDVVPLVRALHHAAERAAELPERDALALVFRAIDDVTQTLQHREDYDDALLRLSARLTLAPRTFDRSHLGELRELGWNDRELHDAVNVCACFAYMNRLADGLGVTHDSARREWAVELFGEEAFEKHLAWGAQQGG